MQIVFQLVASVRFYDHPRAVLLQRTAHVTGSSRGIAHVVQAIEKGHKIIVVARIILCFGDFKADAVGHAGVFRAFCSGLD